jgi:glycerophosphoryl diester phosphodiesterase
VNVSKALVWGAAGLAAIATAAGTVTTRSGDPIVIAHRGASGHRPEHTLEAYRLAIEQGADFIEPDLVATRDGFLVARHENEVSGTTDVADRPEFADRRRTRSIDGQEVTGWFTEDFTLAELKSLRVRERLPELRTTKYDGTFQIPTLEEILDVLAEVNGRPDRERRPVGLYPETKHPSYFAGIGLPLEEPLVEVLHRRGWREANDPVFIQSFEVTNLKKLRDMTRLSLVQLIGPRGQPPDLARAGDPRTYADLITPEGLAEIATYARGIGVHKNLVLPLDGEGGVGAPTSLVGDAHRAGLLVHVWTLRAENAFLPPALRKGESPDEIGDMRREAALFLEAGVDGFFTDHPGLGVSARDDFIASRR